MSQKSSGRAHWLLAALGVALVVGFVASIGLDAIEQQLAQLGPSVLLVLLPYGLGTALTALPWLWLLPPEARPTPGAAIASRFAASGSNALLPFFGVAGEPVRLLWLPRAARPRGLAAVVVDRVLYNSASALLLLLAAIASLFTPLPLALSGAIAGFAALTFLATLAVLWVVAKKGIGERLSRLLRRLLGRSYAAPGFGAEVDASLLLVLKQRHRAKWAGLATHLLGRAVMVAEAYVALRALHSNASAADAFVLGTAPIASSLVASSIPSQLGVQEGVLALTCGALGLSPALGIALSLIARLRQLVFVPMAPVLTSLARPSVPAARVQESFRPSR